MTDLISEQLGQWSKNSMQGQCSILQRHLMQLATQDTKTLQSVVRAEDEFKHLLEGQQRPTVEQAAWLVAHLAKNGGDNNTWSTLVVHYLGYLYEDQQHLFDVGGEHLSGALNLWWQLEERGLLEYVQQLNRQAFLRKIEADFSDDSEEASEG